MSVMRKPSRFLLLLMMFVVVSLSFIPQAAHAGSIKDKIIGSQGTGNVSKLEEQVDGSTQKIVSTVRKIAIPITIIFGLWLGFCYFRAGFSPDSLRETKGRIMFFLVFLVLSFWTETILGAVFNFFGIDLGTL